MAQRGGAVVSNVRIGPKVYSPLIKEGEVDLLLAFEKLEAARWGNYLRPGAIAIVNQHAQPPLGVNLGNERYPGDEEITGILKQRAERIFYVNGTARAREIGDVRTLNIFMLGCASVFLPLKVSIWRETISRYVPARAKEMNIAAFVAGRKEIRNVHLG